MCNRDFLIGAGIIRAERGTEHGCYDTCGTLESIVSSVEAVEGCKIIAIEQTGSDRVRYSHCTFEVLSSRGR